MDTQYFMIAESADVTAAVVLSTRLEMLREGSDTDRSLIATMVSELGSNIVKYAGRGVIRLCRAERRGGVDIDIWAEDSGPGIPDLELALRDHYSTGGSLGLGLPGVRRMGDEFRLNSSPEKGTCVFVRKRIRGRPERFQEYRLPAPGLHPAPLPEPVAGPEWDLGLALRPCHGYRVGGDAAVVVPVDRGLVLGIIDASGHGEQAHQVAESVASRLREEPSGDIEANLKSLDRMLLGTAGASVGLVDLDGDSGVFRYAGVGNTRAAQLGARPWRGVSRDGVLGGRLPSLRVQEARLDPGDLLLLWTDGIPEAECPRLADSISFREAGTIARTVVSRLARAYDDAGCLVLKWRP